MSCSFLENADFLVSSCRFKTFDKTLSNQQRFHMKVCLIDVFCISHAYPWGNPGAFLPSLKQVKSHKAHGSLEV